MVVRISHVDSAIGPSVPISIAAELLKRRATHASLHANRIKSLAVDVQAARRRAKVEEEDAIRRGARLEHLVDLDLSSNRLHAGYSPPCFGIPEKATLLEISTNLRKLNLSSNGLTENSLAALIGSGPEKDSGCLMRLKSLDLSNNSLSRLPPNLHLLCPSLTRLLCANNKIKSLTALLQALRGFRGGIEDVRFASDGGGPSGNTVCSKELYREKTIFVLGSALTRLDGGGVDATERRRARLKLERGVSGLPGTAATGAMIPARGRPPPAGIGFAVGGADGTVEKVPQDECDWMERDQNWRGGYEEDGIESVRRRRNYCEKSAADDGVKSLRDQVSALSALVGQQVCHSNKGIPRACNGCATSPFHGGGETSQFQKTTRSSASQTGMLDSNKAAVCAMSLFKVVLNRKAKTNLYLSFTLWVLSTGLMRNVQKSKEKHIQDEKAWQLKAKELVSRAVGNQMECGKRKLDASEKQLQASNGEISRLKQQVKDLEDGLEREKKSQILAGETSRQALAALKTDIDRVERDSDKQKELARLAEVEAEGLRRELQSAKEALDREQSGRTKLESAMNQMSIANQEAKDNATSQVAQVHELKLEVLQKDATIQRLKDTYQQAARRSAQALKVESRAKDLLQQQAAKLHEMEMAYTQAAKKSAHTLRAENQAKDLLQKQTAKVKKLEGEIADQKSALFAIQNENRANACKASRMENEIDEKCRREKSILDEHDEIRRQLAECSRARARAEDRNDHLQALIDRADNDARRSKQRSIERARLEEEEASRAKDLERSLELLRRSSQRRELELRDRNEAMRRENIALRENAARHEKTAKALNVKLQTSKNEWKIRQGQIASSHRIDMQKWKDEKERELASAGESLEAERSIRLDAEKRVASLETEKKKMQDAIEGLAKQLTGA